MFLPPIGGMTIYMFGDVQTIADPSRPLAARVHDECNGSDVFGSDICTCRPYLAHGIEECVRTAQSGGAGVIVYNRKEGRALGEVTKFLVYNARKRQKGGDSAAQYFARTECVAGVQDMRFQELMPDVLHWLGITKIDRFVSMSNMKYDAVVRSGIRIVERVADPRRARSPPTPGWRWTPRWPPATTPRRRRPRRQRAEPSQGPGSDRVTGAAYLRSARAVRERAQAMLALAERGRAGRTSGSTGRGCRRLSNGSSQVTRANHPDLTAIPPHARWRHFDAGGVSRLAAFEARLRDLPADEALRARFDLVVTSVLLDAGAGPRWSFRELATGQVFTRSEGLAVASYHAFLAGTFSSDPPRHPLRADAAGLRALTETTLGRAFQAEDGSLPGLAGRARLLRRLGEVVAASPSHFAGVVPRVGNLADHLRAQAAGGALPAAALLTAVLDALGSIWPGRLRARRRRAGGHLAAPAARAGAVPQAVAVAELLADRAAGGGRRPGGGAGSS